MLNNSGPRYKRSQLEQKMNIDVVWCVIILILLCLVGAIGSQLWKKHYTDAPFVFDQESSMEGILMFFRLIIIFQVRNFWFDWWNFL
jgi:phospholipid-translocating ATPase